MCWSGQTNRYVPFIFVHSWYWQQIEVIMLKRLYLKMWNVKLGICFSVEHSLCSFFLFFLSSSLWLKCTRKRNIYSSIVFQNITIEILKSPWRRVITIFMRANLRDWIMLCFSREDFRKEFQEQNPDVKSMRDASIQVQFAFIYISLISTMFHV